MVIKYKINNGEEQIINGTSGSFTLAEDGNYLITAWIEDNIGHKSAETPATLTKDTTGPTVSLDVGTVTTNTIPVTATAEDIVSRNSKLYI